VSLTSEGEFTVKQVACAPIGVMAEVSVFEVEDAGDGLLLVSPKQLAKNTVQASNAMRNMGCTLKPGASFNFSPPLLSRNSAYFIFGDVVGLCLFTARISGLLYSIRFILQTSAGMVTIKSLIPPHLGS
jgi:hypothetical protein